MPKRQKIDFETLLKEFDIDNDIINLLAYNYKKITTMNSEELAYEYLKRNPLFLIEAINDITKLETIENNIEEYIYEMKYYYQRVFLYNPIDIYARCTNYNDITMNSKIDNLEKKMKKAYSYSFQNYIKEGDTSKSRYVNLYNIDINNKKKAKYDALKNKQTNTIVLDDFLTNPVKNNRWLNWLRPSINIEFNPNKNKDELKEMFQKLLTQFEENEKLSNINNISAPNYLIDNFNLENFKNESLLLDIKSPRNAAIKLLFYDAKYIFGIDSEFSFDKFRSIFEMAFSEDFDSYIDLNSSKKDAYSNTYKTHFSVKAKRARNEAKKYIYGSYLKLIYPNISIEKHFYDVKDIAEIKLGNLAFKNITEISEEEYLKMNNENILYASSEKKFNIIKFLLRSPMDEIETRN